MTDRISSFVVVLDHDRREDDTLKILTALSMIRGVISVVANVSGIEQTVAEARSATEWRGRMIAMIEELKR